MPEQQREDVDVGDDLEGFKMQPGHLLRRAQQIAGALWGEHVGTTLTSAQYAVLSVLSDVPAMDQVSITQSASLDRSTLADVLSRLESKQLVTRDRNKLDARRNLVSLTDLGRELLESVAPAARTVDRELIACFDEDERADFVQHLRGLVAHGEDRLARRADRRPGLSSAPRSGAEAPAATGHPSVDQ